MCAQLPPGPQPQAWEQPVYSRLGGLQLKTGLPAAGHTPLTHSKLAPAFPVSLFQALGRVFRHLCQNLHGRGKETLETSFSTVSTQCFPLLALLASTLLLHPRSHKTAGAFYSSSLQPQMPPTSVLIYCSSIRTHCKVGGWGRVLRLLWLSLSLMQPAPHPLCFIPTLML